MSALIPCAIRLNRPLLAGFGTLEVLPALMSDDIEGVYPRHLRYRVDIRDNLA
jgi:hypothetical protein